MSAQPRRGTGTEADVAGWDCGHETDEHVGALGSCIAYVIAQGRETFCLCRCFTPDAA